MVPDCLTFVPLGKRPRNHQFGLGQHSWVSLSCFILKMTFNIPRLQRSQIPIPVTFSPPKAQTWQLSIVNKVRVLLQLWTDCNIIESNYPCSHVWILVIPWASSLHYFQSGVAFFSWFILWPVYALIASNQLVLRHYHCLLPSTIPSIMSLSNEADRTPWAN